MIHGTVYGREATIPLEFFGPLGNSAILTVAIDTGYTGVLLLPQNIIATLGLTLNGSRQVRLADGTVIALETFDVEVRWHDQVISVIASKIDSEPLLGMSMLSNNRLTMEVRNNGAVTVEELPITSP